MTEFGTNTPEALSVSELSQKLKRSIEKDFDFVRIRGELSTVKIHSSGHLYTDLKDDKALINAVCWRGTVGTLSVKPEEGIEVICTGKITTYPARSNYQLVIDTMEYAGQGAILKVLEDRKKRLTAEGLFDSSRKLKIPKMPNKIGIITSPTGAVIQDMLHRIGDRFPLSILFWPAAVQGENTVRDVVAGINAFALLSQGQRPDVIIIARGGGSFEDLMPFNDEEIVRAVANSPIPIISAIGHETDTTLIDYAASMRAPTPSAAAEFAVPVLSQLVQILLKHASSLASYTNNEISKSISQLENFSLRLGKPEQITQAYEQRIDTLEYQLESGLRNTIQNARIHFSKIIPQLKIPDALLERQSEKIHLYSTKIDSVWKNSLDKYTSKLDKYSSLLESYSYHNILKRGFALVNDHEGNVITLSAQVKKDHDLIITFADGRVKTRAEK
jgi:exodeoxyribonuclease VII large subunit